MNVQVRYWSYNDGWQFVTPVLREHYVSTGELRSVDDTYMKVSNPHWFCWVYTSDDIEFKRWFDANMGPQAEAVQRFNGGDPMWTVRVEDKNDAIKFAHKFGFDYYTGREHDSDPQLS